jgi:hypothetical protein
MAADNYWVKRNGKIQGPIAYEKVVAAIRGGKVLPSDDIGKSPDGPWQKIASAMSKSRDAVPASAAVASPSIPEEQADARLAQRRRGSAAAGEIDPRVGLKREHGAWTCPRCGSHDAYEGTVKEFQRGPTIMREVGDTGMYFGATGGRYYRALQMKCRSCGEELYWDQHYEASLYEQALDGARRMWAIKIALPISLLLFAAVMWAAYAWIVPLCRTSDQISPQRQEDKFVENQKALAEMRLSEARDIAAQQGDEQAAAKALKGAANAYVDAWMFDEAVPIYERVLPMQTKSLGADAEETKQTLQYLQSAKNKVIPWDPQRPQKKIEVVKASSWGQEAIFKIVLWPVAIIGCLLFCRLIVHVVEPLAPF